MKNYDIIIPVMCLSGGDNVVAINEMTSLLPFALTD